MGPRAVTGPQPAAAADALIMIKGTQATAIHHGLDVVLRQGAQPCSGGAEADRGTQGAARRGAAAAIVDAVGSRPMVITPPWLRPVVATDLPELVDLYRDAVLSQAACLYSQEQIAAWAHHAGRDPGFAAALARGWGLASCSGPTGTSIEAFGLLDPIDRLSLLYCRGRSSRQGRGRALVRSLEWEARRRGCLQLRTEASQLSRPLLQRLGWRVEAEEEVRFAGELFRRWRMIRTLN